MRETLYERLKTSGKYALVCEDTLRRVCEDCEARYQKAKDAEKAAKEKLHGLTGAFLSKEEAARCAKRIAASARELSNADLEGILGCHASTRERLPLERTDAIFEHIFEISGRPRRVLDLACGIDPIYLAARGIPVTGIDISGQSVELIGEFARAFGADARAVCGDLFCGCLPENERFDLALLFKTLPLLERERAGFGKAFLAAIPAEYIAVSFPTRTLGGRNVGMESHYARMIGDCLPENKELIERFTEGNELFCILKER